MNSRAVILTVIFLNFNCFVKSSNESMEFSLDNFESKLRGFANSLTKWLEKLNDKYLGTSEFYNDMKPTLEDTGNQSRGLKKVGLALLPLIFHVGATSTWMLITTLLAAKSVAIGMLLLIFKIAVSSAKVASFFTALKGKHSSHEWTPHYESHHGQLRSLTEDHHPTYIEPTYHEYPGYLDHPPSHSESSPEWTPASYFTGKSNYKRDIASFKPKNGD